MLISQAHITSSFPAPLPAPLTHTSSLPFPPTHIFHLLRCGSILHRLESFWKILPHCELAIGCSFCQENCSSTDSPQTEIPDREERILSISPLHSHTDQEKSGQVQPKLLWGKIQYNTGSPKPQCLWQQKKVAVQIFSTTTVPVRRTCSKMALQRCALCQ